MKGLATDLNEAGAFLQVHGQLNRCRRVVVSNSLTDHGVKTLFIRR